MHTARFIFVFGLLSLVFCLFTAPVLAQSENPTITPSPVVQTNPNTTPNTNPDVPKNLHNWTQNVMIEVMLSLTCQLVGIDPTRPNGQCLGVDQTTGKIGFLPAGNLKKGEIGGAIGGMNNMISMLYTPPIRTGDYFQNLAQNFGIVKHANAQTSGTGFNSLKPLLSLWTAFRNIVYLIFVLVFIVIGLAIMLRVKIDPRTVMTIQNQIPKIIIGILLVTFSFAIAGFLVDLMWVVIYLVFGLIAGISEPIAKSVAELNPAGLVGKNPLGAALGFGQLSSMVHNVASSTKDVMQNLLDIKGGGLEIFNPIALVTDLFDASKRGSVVNWMIDLLSTGAGIFTFFKVANLQVPHFVLPILGDILNAFGVGGVYAAAGAAGYATFAGTEALLRNWLPYLIIYIIVFIALLIALFRLWLALLMAFINILIDVVLAPFWIVGSLVPGSPVSATGWLRDLIANLAAFPAVIVMFLLGKVFVDAFTTAPTPPFVPPLIGNPGDPSMIGSLIGIGIIFMTPNVVAMVKAALKAPKLDTGGVGRAIGVGAGLPVRSIQSAAGIYGASRYDISGQVNPEGRAGRIFMRLFGGR